MTKTDVLTEEVRGILRGTVEILRDPDRVVLNPDDLWETADGQPACDPREEGVTRFCVIGALGGAAGAGRECHYGYAFSAVLGALGNPTEALRRDGASVCADRIEAVL